MRPKAVRSALALALLVALGTGCGSQPPQSPPSGVDELVIPTPSPRAADFSGSVTNPFLPLAPGSTWVYGVTGSDDVQRMTVSVLEAPREVAGVSTTVVHQVRTGQGGRVVEESYDWYAQDRDGNVWKFGTEGTWEAGVDGAQAGLMMPATPRVGDGFVQGMLAGVAEGRATVAKVDAEAVVPGGEFTDVVQIEVSLPAEPGTSRRTSYAAGVGPVLAVSSGGSREIVQLRSFTAG
ncbi:hypothetical protein [Nocardioides sp.]|uniref:hypothetical protein n=1 Tax=Nocardioides sp. TaxID=35761 RepID=UPI003D09B3FA